MVDSVVLFLWCSSKNKGNHGDTDHFTVYSLDQSNFLGSIATCARVVLACSVDALKGADEWQP